MDTDWRNVKDFGATGDGVTDDTAAINATIVACNAAGGGTVYLPVGSYLVSGAGISLLSGVTLKGSTRHTPWFFPNVGSRIVCSSVMSSPLVSITSETYYAIEDISFACVSGTTTAPTIQVGGSTRGGMGNFQNIESSYLGGIYTANCDRLRFDNVVLQNWTGMYGFSFTDTTIIMMTWCASAPNGVGTSAAGPYAAHWKVDGSGSLTMLNCGGAGTPYYGIDILNAISLSLFDWENNGATQAVVHVTGSGNGDINFIRPYNNGAACVNAVQVDGTCNLDGFLFTEGNVGSYTGSFLNVSPSSGNTVRSRVTNCYISDTSDSPVFNFAGSSANWNISGNTLVSNAAAPVLIKDASSWPYRLMSFTGNVCEFTANPAVSVTGTVVGGYGWEISGNPGLTGVVPAQAVPVSGTAFFNNTGYDCTVYLHGGTVSAVAIGGTATGLTSGAFRVPAGRAITVTYTVKPAWLWVPD